MVLLLLSRFSRVRLCDPIDGSPPGSPIPGILQGSTQLLLNIYFTYLFSQVSLWNQKQVQNAYAVLKVCAEQILPFT